ncbi:hypothetical protein RSOLAG1IB_11928 [Rhizoctonia solani AG-1 IB]|nr:hypothetical protein RSOLAG1IB_11928 [Rhizoctonia solani AG-1 IB]
MAGIGEPDHPEKEDVSKTSSHHELGLPSSYLKETIQGCGLNRVAALEGKLRRAACNEALHELRELLGLKTLALRWKRKNLSGKVATTRAEASLKVHQEKVVWAKAEYQQSWQALMQLRLNSDDPHTYRELKQEDIKNLKEYLEIESAELGDGIREIPWIWRAASIKNKEEWQIEALRVEWFRSRQRVKQWEEELILLKKDMLMAVRGFEVLATKWQWKSEVGGLESGMSKYAARQAWFHCKLKAKLFHKCDQHIKDKVVQLKWAESYWPANSTAKSIT